MDKFSENISTVTEAVYAIVAMGREGEIGFDGGMPWHLPEDLRHFKELTVGHPVVMGRSTWESLPRRPLPGRCNVVLSRSVAGVEEGEGLFEGAVVAGSVGDALAAASGGEVPFIIGGGKVYEETLPLVSRLYVTRIDAVFPQADTRFPALEGFRLAERSEEMESRTGLRYRFETYVR